MICLFCLNNILEPKIILKAGGSGVTTICEDCCDIAHAALSARRISDRNTVKIANPDNPREFILVEKISAIIADG